MWDCVIIGGGPAGLTAATYLGRFEREVLLVDAGKSRLLRIPMTHNVPGFADGIAGVALLAQLKDQAGRYGARFCAGRADGLARRDQSYYVSIGEDSVTARTVLIATGTVLSEPVTPGLAEAVERGLVRYCPICDGFEARGLNIAVLGGRPGAIGEAHFLRGYSSRVTYAHIEGGRLHTAEVQTARAAGIRVIETPVSRITLKEQAELGFGDQCQEAFDVLYPCLGCAPQSDLARGVGALCSTGGGIVADAHQQTNIPGLFAAGDVLQGVDQIASACGQGAIAAVAMHNWLRHQTAKIT